jgi:hypothetical protein
MHVSMTNTKHMHTTLTHSQAKDLLLQDEYASWTPAQAGALADYYEELENETGKSIKLDITAMRCEWTAYDSLPDIHNDYDKEDIQEMMDEGRIIECDDDTFLVR